MFIVYSPCLWWKTQWKTACCLSRIATETCWKIQLVSFISPVKQVESRGSTIYHVATVLRGSVGTTWSTTSLGEQCRVPKFQQQRNHQVYYEVTTSVQTVLRLYRGSKVNVLHEMWQCLTPMRNHICQQQSRT